MIGLIVPSTDDSLFVATKSKVGGTTPSSLFRSTVYILTIMTTAAASPFVVGKSLLPVIMSMMLIFII